MASVQGCTKCHRTKPVKLRRQIAASGAVQLGWYCLECKNWANPTNAFISHKQVKHWLFTGKLKCLSIDEIPLIADYRTNCICEVCGAQGGELHHWLPQAFSNLVDNHAQWPTAYLCQSCHREWHNIVTPYLTGKNWKERYENSTDQQ